MTSFTRTVLGHLSLPYVGDVPEDHGVQGTQLSTYTINEPRLCSKTRGLRTSTRDTGCPTYESKQRIKLTLQVVITGVVTHRPRV